MSVFFLLSACHVFERPEIKFTCDDIPECTESDVDVDVDADTDADTDTGKSTGPTPTDEDCDDGLDNDLDTLIDCEDDDCLKDPACIEDCTDGLDNDLDGLTDCEDDDCLAVCIEDCGDKKDNDQDGFADCDDDECYGVGGCGGPYKLSMSTRFSLLALATGEDIEQIGLNWTFSYNVAMYAYGYVDISAAPYGWDGEAFACTGYLYGGFDVPYRTDIFTYIGPQSEVDYAMALTPTASSGTLTWTNVPPACPIESLPETVLGFTDRSNIIYRDVVGSWQRQYYSAQHTYQEDKNYDLTFTYLYGVYPYSSIEWTGTY